MSGGLRVIDADEVRRRLTIEACIPLVRQAMIALSAGTVRQLLRSFIGMGEGRTFALMPAALPSGDWGVEAPFGAKLVSVFADPSHPGHRAHEGLVVLFDGETGRPVSVADGSEITRIRTAAASAVATDALARPNASTLAVLGLGAQARTHIESIARVRPLQSVRVWGRDLHQAERFAQAMQDEHSLPVEAVARAAAAVDGADIVCSVTTAADPILEGAWIAPGTHLNIVGSSAPTAAEIDSDLVVRSLFIADHREHVLAHGGEFVRARAAGRVGDDHVVAEIGDVLSGNHPGRTAADQITLYKSLGHAVQDLAAAAWLYAQPRLPDVQ
jgi:ornithine cyclodeaminase/alanine dehydrogenase-like protein (mu-crystallin family)